MFIWDKKKNERLSKGRRVTFEEVVERIVANDVLDILEYKTRKHQRIFVVNLKGRVHAAPFILDESENIILKTIYPSRKLQRRYGKEKNRVKLDAYEQSIEESLEEYSPALPAEKRRILGIAAKTRTISLRLNEAVLERLKRKAAAEGLPYQTLISSVLFKFSSDRLIDKDAVQQALKALK